MKPISILERDVDVRHQIPERVAMLATNAGGAYISIGHAETEVAKFFSLDPGNLHFFASKVERMINGHNVLEALGLHARPTVHKKID